MPVTPAYEWREAETSLSVDIKIRAVTPSSADILMTDCYAKVNCAPYFFEADLFDEIDPRRSSASVGQDTIKFFFIKKEPGLWGRLTLPGDRKMVLDRRHRSLAAIREQAHKDREDFPAKLSNIGRLAVGEQMKLEEARRKAIEQKKEEELRKEQESLKSWMESTASQSIKRTDIRDMSDEPCSELEKKATEMSTGDTRGEVSNLARECHDLQRCSSSSGITESFTKRRDVYPQPTTWLPAPRRSSKIPISFSVKPDRPIHLPARESRDVVHLKKKEDASADASNPTEGEPIFLQDKADKFFGPQMTSASQNVRTANCLGNVSMVKVDASSLILNASGERSGDYQSAINAYTSALESDPSLILLQLGQYEDCRRDCFKAIQLLQHVMPARNLATSPQSESLRSDGSLEQCSESPTGQILFTSLELSKCVKAHGLGEDPDRWEATVKKHILLLGGTANYHEGKLQHALEDYVKALQFEPTHKELEHIVTHMKHLLKM